MIRSIASVALLLAAGAVSPVAAQGHDHAADVRKRNDCRLAAQVLTSGHPEPRTDWARAYIVSCEDEGPAYFAAQWAGASTDTAALHWLVDGSTGIRDERVYTSMRRAAADRSRPDIVRIAALIGVASYADPTLAISIGLLRPPEGHPERIRYTGGSRMHVVHLPGAHPLGDVGDEVLSLLNAVAADRAGEPRTIWYAAAVLARRVQSRLHPPAAP